MGIQLIGVAGPMRGKAMDLNSGSHLVGRGPGSDVRLGDDTNVSRDHAVIRVRNGSAEIQDKESRNGTWVNGERILVGELRDGDALRIGDSEFVIRRIVEPIPQPPTSQPPTSQPVIRYAGFWVRFAATAVDFLVVTLPFMLLVHLVRMSVPAVNTQPMKWGTLGLILYAIAYGAYVAWLDGSYGQTLGRMSTGIKVVNSNRRKITTGEALIRYLVHVATVRVGPIVILFIAFMFSAAMVADRSYSDFSLLFQGMDGSTTAAASFVVLIAAAFLIFYYILLAANPKKQGWHDMAAGTVVVYDSK